MKRKIYRSLSGIRQAMLVLLGILSCTAYAQTTYTFNYTGSIQTITLQPGSYSITCWGAHGGWHASDPLMQRGKGGYSTGTVSLTATTTLYVAAGGAGGTQLSSSVPGGWNGGGDAKYYSYSYNGGGGASHVATATGVLSSLATNTPAILIVAGGGGGGASSQSPGHGGALNGTNGTRTGCTGGTQTGPGASSIAGGNATFGQGWDGTPTGGSYGAGGGGWYGGGCESGGSGYIGGVSNGTTIAFGQTGFVANPDATGNGKVLITELCSIAILVSGNSTISPAICSGQSLTLTTNATSNYSWSTGQTTSSIVVAPNTNTVYSLVATSSLNCTAGATKSVSVNSAPPVISIANPSNNICLGQSATLTASGALSYTWTNAGVVNGQSFTPVSTAAYTVTGSNGCGTGVASTTITVSPLAVTAVTSPTLVCEGSTATLSAMSAVNGYTWQPGPLTNSVVVVAPGSTTIYTVTASDGICSGTQTVLLTTKTTPTITATASSSMICPGDQVVLSATGGSTYLWTPGNLTGSSVTVSPLTSTLYAVAGTNSVNCTANANQIVLVNASPTVVINASKPATCPGGEVVLTASGANSYAWIAGPATPVYSVYPNSTTVYTVVGTQNNNPCTDTRTVLVNVVVPNVTATSNTATCEGGSVQLAASGANSYAWNGINGGTITVSPFATTVYTLVAQTSSGSVVCPTTLTVLVTVNLNPTISVTASRNVICKGESNTLTATGAATYTWQGSLGTGSVVVVKPNTTTTYTLMGTSNEGCSTQSLVMAVVNSCNGIREYGNSAQISVYPNPNNGHFVVSAQSAINLNLINTLGQVVRTIELHSGNAFSVELSGLPKGVYYLGSGSGALPNVHSKIVVE